MVRGGGVRFEGSRRRRRRGSCSGVDVSLQDAEVRGLHYHDPYSIKVFDCFLWWSCHCGVRYGGLRNVGDSNVICKASSYLKAVGSYLLQ